jgi:hypothetical protein
MHFQKILDEKGCSQRRLREIFTAPVAPETPAQVSMDHVEPPKRDTSPSGIRTRFQSRIRSRLLDGIGNNCRVNRPMQAVDLAWDSPPIQKETIPLMLWAQGKITIKQAYDQLCPTAAPGTTPPPNQFFRKVGEDILELNKVRICEVTVDLMKSYITRRHAAMDSLWSQLWPLFKYDPRGLDDLSLFRADVLTQRVDIMADAYNYRHFRSQCNRQMLLYGWSCAFPRSAWDRTDGWRIKKTNTGEEGDEIESYIKREGLDFVNPHPARIYYDASAPLPNINTDTGPKWIGYWDIVRYGTLLEQGADYFNVNHIFVSDGWIDLATQFSTFFQTYFNPTVMTFPECGGSDPSLWNDVKVKVGRYTSESVDQGILLTQHFEKINPLEEGIGEYNADVWLRLVVAGDCTIVGAEFMPSLPACYGGINIADGRFANQSMGMALLGYQDQATNIVTHMLQQLRASMIQLVLLDTDSLPPDIVGEITKNAKNKDWWLELKVLPYSATKLKDVGFQDPRQAFVIVQNQITNVIDGALKALAQLLNLADRLLVLSPNEQGQPNPREVSAREVNEVSTSVQSIYSFINSGPREQVASMKRMIFESLITCASQNIRVPVEKRYTADVIKRAGFTIPDDVKEMIAVRNAKNVSPGKPGQEQGPPQDDLLPSQTPVMGNLRDLNYDYYFDSRDGSERQVNAQGAQVIMSLAQFLFKLPGVPEKMGMKSMLDMANLIIRMSGAPWNFQFDLPVGQSDEMGAAGPQGDPMKMIQAIAQQLAQLGGGLQKVEQLLMTQFHVSPAELGIQPGPPGAPGAGAHTALHPAQPPGAHPPGPAPAAPHPVGAVAPQPTAAQTLAEPAGNPS